MLNRLAVPVHYAVIDHYVVRCRVRQQGFMAHVFTESTSRDTSVRCFGGNRKVIVDPSDTGLNALTYP